MSTIEPLPLGMPSDHLADAMAYAMRAIEANDAPDVMVVLIGQSPPRRRGGDHIDPSVLETFETLIAELDTHVITRAGWDRLKSILVEATLAAGDAEAGARGFARIEPAWPLSKHYDGKP